MSLVLLVHTCYQKSNYRTIGQGTILFPDLVDLAEEDISTLCSAIRHPGGLIND
jgi:hypothetical protein